MNSFVPNVELDRTMTSPLLSKYSNDQFMLASIISLLAIKQNRSL